jgi:hypothetical protein
MQASLPHSVLLVYRQAGSNCVPCTAKLTSFPLQIATMQQSALEMRCGGCTTLCSARMRSGQSMSVSFRSHTCTVASIQQTAPWLSCVAFWTSARTSASGLRRPICVTCLKASGSSTGEPFPSCSSTRPAFQPSFWHC